jgi:phage terminase Nu1 subunit (DNA packaging protein)
VTSRRNPPPSTEELATAAGVEPRQVNRDRRKGAPTGSVEAYVAWRRSNIRQYSGGTGRVSYSVGEETARLRSAQAEAQELEVAQKRRELLDREVVKQAVLSAGAVFNAQLDALPGRMANELAACNDPALVRAKLRDECRRILEATAAEFARLADEADRGDGDSGSEPDPRPVGGSVPDPAAG